MNTLRKRELVAQYEHQIETLIKHGNIREWAIEGLDETTVEERDYLRSLHLEVELIG